MKVFNAIFTSPNNISIIAGLIQKALGLNSLVVFRSDLSRPFLGRTQATLGEFEIAQVDPNR